MEIEARIVQTTATARKALGVQWGFNGRIDPTLGNTHRPGVPEQRQRSPDRRAAGRRATGGASTCATGPSAIGLALGSVNGALNLDVALSALERTGKGRLLSTPRVSTQNNVEAEITQGVADSDSDRRQQHRDGDLQGRRADPAGHAADHGAEHGDHAHLPRERRARLQPGHGRRHPARSTRSARVTTVLVADGETTVIGGIFT